MTNKLLGISVEDISKKEVLEKIKKYIGDQKSKGKSQKEFLHIVSLNPENMVIACEDEKFRQVVNEAQIKIIDGVGVHFSLGLRGERVAGVDLVDEIIKLAHTERLEGLLIGGKENVADTLADCYKQKFPNLKLTGIQGIDDIKNVKKEEKEKIFSIVRRNRPHFILAAFGSPAQELFLASNKEELRGIVCMGVGGAFDFLSGRVSRSSVLLQRVGLEWFYRLLRQPWRIRRQTRLLKFIFLVMKEKLGFPV